MPPLERQAHTYGPKCRLAPVTYPRSDSAWLKGIPLLNAHFFYSSPIPIDDPLSTAAITTSTDGKLHPTRPFSQGDNNALEKAWLSLASRDDGRNHMQARTRRSPSPSLARANSEKLAAIVQKLALHHKEMHIGDHLVQDSSMASPEPLQDFGAPVCCLELPVDVSSELQKAFCPVTRSKWQALSQEGVVQEVMMHLRQAASGSSIPPVGAHQNLPSVTAEEPQRGASVGLEPTASSAPSFNEFAAARMGGDDAPRTTAHAGALDYSGRNLPLPAVPSHQAPSDESSMSMTPPGVPIPIRPPVVDDGISGKPFVRVEMLDTPRSLTPGSLPKHDISVRESKPSDHGGNVLTAGQTHRKSRPAYEHTLGAGEEEENCVQIPVGISRLHLVVLPLLQMKPIYWSPVNDVSIVLRATWFYRDSMMPVEPAVANQLESGYRELRPWTETWGDELRCAVEVGPLGEEKLSHPLWPQVVNRGSRKNAKSQADIGSAISTDPSCAARCFQGEAAAEGTLEPIHRGSDDDTTAPGSAPKSYTKHHVIYKDGSTAFMLKPSLQPSAYYGRRPVTKIAKGMAVGIPVIRGFDRPVWDRIHGDKKRAPSDGLPATPAADEPEAGHGQTACPGCREEKMRAQVTDLVLVAHGVGQKLAERVESYHFTFAINAFRRAINVELATDAVRAVLRDGQNGIMVLPVNWRNTVSFEDGEAPKDEDAAGSVVNDFTLKDIEPSTIPAIRGMISDVMFDIPFYMSQHKPRMIQALVREANRVYRLWCRNNPGFAESGRVHLIGHSLGSAMAIEVLSKQPTEPPRLDTTLPLMQTKFFEFDTKNLFLLGSPAGFFLLLERGRLMPRRGRRKPGVDPADIIAKDLVGEAGTFGCLAVDNIYNILAKEDPIAYLLNGAVDVNYASSLKAAFAPSAAQSFFAAAGQTVRNLVLGKTVPAESSSLSAPAIHKPLPVRLPSQLELEVHDFTREEIAEKRMMLLNDNGQIDYFLRSGGGPLEIQYLNMLSAHTSYWTNHDLIRLLCLEVGRKPGKENTLPSMRAVKATKRFISVAH